MKVLILAGGKGTRLQSEKFNLPKALRKLKEKTLIEHVLDNASFIEAKDTYIVIGYKREMILEVIDNKYNFVIQEQQLGTGHATMVTEEFLKDYDEDLLLLYGDMPLISKSILKKFIKCHCDKHSKCTIMTAIFENQPPYGRIIRDKEGNFKRVVEEKDCSQEELKIKELNCGPYIINSKILFQALKKLKNNNSQKEYYLTDVPEIIKEMGIEINIFINDTCKEMIGVNTLEDLKECETMIETNFK